MWGLVVGLFLQQYSRHLHGFIVSMTSGSLHMFKQWPNENLWEFFQHFTMVKLQVQRLSDQAIINVAT
jgi:hypothetical protein